MANLIDFNINQLAVMIACVHIMDVIIFQKMVASIHLPLRSLCILCLLFQIWGRGKGSKHTRLESINFTIFSFLQGALHYCSHRNTRVCPKEGILSLCS